MSSTAEPLGKPEEAEASSKKHYPGQALEASGITQERRAETEGEEVKLRWFGGSEHFWRQKHGVQRCPRSEMRLEGMGVNWIDPRRKICQEEIHGFVQGRVKCSYYYKTLSSKDNDVNDGEHPK